MNRYTCEQRVSILTDIASLKSTMIHPPNSFRPRVGLSLFWLPKLVQEWLLVVLGTVACVRHCLGLYICRRIKDVHLKLLMNAGIEIGHAS